MPDIQSLFALAEADNAAGLMQALAKHADAMPPVSENGETLFLFCTYRGRTKCAEVLAKRGQLTLHEAAAAGDVARIEACLAAAPWSIQSLSADGWTALHLAAFLGRDEALLLLLDHGAPARQWGRAFDPNLALHAACAGRRLGKPAFAKLIEATGDPDVAQMPSGLTALMIAAGNGFADGVDALLAASADRSRKTGEGKTAADFARERGHAHIADRLG